jgi:predicted RNA methylase
MDANHDKARDISKLKYLFGKSYNDWSYTDSSAGDQYLMYVTPDIIARQVVKSSNARFQLRNKVVWDMFAGIGTDTLRFSQISGKVVSTEIDPLIFENLKKNVTSLQDRTNIEIHNMDCCEYEKNAEIDVVYFDPPWGSTFRSGSHFSFDNVALANGEKVLDIAKRLHQKYPMIIKSPAMCYSFEDLFSTEQITTQVYYKQKLKFLFVNKAEK